MPMPSALSSILANIPSMPRGAAPSPGSTGGPVPAGPGAASPPLSGAAPGSPTPGGGLDAIFGQVLNSRLSAAPGADNSYITEQLKQMKIATASLLPKAVLRLPGLDKHINNIYRAIDAAIKESEKATSPATPMASSPIDFSGASLSPAGPGLPANAMLP